MDTCTLPIHAGIIIDAYAPLGSPSRFGRSDSDPFVMEDPVINEIAAKKGATAAQVCTDYPRYRLGNYTYSSN